MFKYRPNCDLRLPVHQKLVVYVCTKATLEAGRTVALHCNASFHRGPVLALAVLRCLCGVPAQGFMEWLSRHRSIWPGHVMPVQNPSHRDQQLFDSLTWAARLTRRGGTQPQAASSQPAPGQLPVWVYRAMRQDGDDLEPTPGWTCPVGLDLRVAVARAVSRGSRERSPFLHASRDWQMAHRWCHKIMHPTHPDIATSSNALPLSCYRAEVRHCLPRCFRNLATC